MKIQAVMSTYAERINTTSRVLPFTSSKSLKVSHKSSKRDRTLKIVNEIASYNRIDGYASTFELANSQYPRLLTLVEEHNAKELIDLLNHGSATVRAYAYWALVRKAYPSLEQVLLMFKGNKQMVSYYSAGSYKEMRLIDFMLDVSIQESRTMRKSLVSDSTLIALRKRK